MSDPAKKKASAVSTLPRKKKPVADDSAQRTRKPASTQEERGAASQVVKGHEIIRAKRIPFVRRGSGDYFVTTYGSQDAADHVKGITFLVKHERRGVSSWGTVAAGHVLEKGPVTNKLQGILNTTAGNNLFHAVCHVRLFPQSLSVIGDEHTSGRIILDAILKDITGGYTRHCDILAKCIEAAPLREQETKREKIIEALRTLANKRNRIPTKSEVQQEWEGAESDGRDSRNFEKELKAMGLGWLPA